MIQPTRVFVSRPEGARIQLLVAVFIATVGLHVQLGDVTGSDLAARSQFVVADLVAVALVLASGGALVGGPLRRWVPFGAWLAFNCLVWGEFGRYAIVNKLAGIGLLVLACSAIVGHLRRRGEGATLAAAEFFITVAAIESVIAVVALQLSPEAVLPFNVPLNFGGVRASGFMVDPNAFGGFAAVALMLSLGLARTARRPSVHRLREVVLFAGVFFSYSRTVWAAVVLAGAYLLFTSSNRTRARFVVLGLTAAMLYVTSKISLPVDRDLVVRSFTVEQRTSGAEAAVREWQTSPLIGIGVGQYVSRHQFIVHNSPLWVLTELGAVGLAIFAYASAGLVQSVRRCARTAPWMYRGLVSGGIAVATMGMGIEIMYQRYVWLLFAIVYASATLQPADEQPNTAAGLSRLGGAAAV